MILIRKKTKNYDIEEMKFKELNEFKNEDKSIFLRFFSTSLFWCLDLILKSAESQRVKIRGCPRKHLNTQ